ncbi:hypothetical protein IEO21_11165 [Rhodonia placenta]|uniref:Uncharacterized protein n=1 Tax=Rhodonia placenta TaxID=104341 RepID=A0A8H7NR84_9APHY|nr:hypothetical protein IEO21_11165 [Postia placenta]
MTVSGPSGM